MSETIHKITRKVFLDSPRFEVPRYQREYSWQSEQITQLLSDIDSVELNVISIDDIEAATNHFVGLLVFIDESNENGERVYTVVDGQQRLSTFILIAAVAKDVINELISQPSITVEASTKLKTIKDHFEQYIYISSRPFGKKTQKLLPNNNDKNIYEILVLTEGNLEDKKKSILEKLGRSGLSRKYFKAYQQIYAHLLDKSKESDFLINFFVKFDAGVSFIPFISQSDTDAFNLFECLNDRGMRLSSIDLIKNKVLQQARENELESFENTWSEVLGGNGAISPDQSQSFIRNYLMIKNGHISKDDVYKTCKDSLKNNSAANSFLKDISFYGIYFRDITTVYEIQPSGQVVDYINDDQISEILFLLNKTKVKQWQALGLIAYTLFKESKINKKDFLDILNLVLKLCIRFKILNIRFNIIEKIIPHIAKSLFESKVDGVSKTHSEVIDFSKSELTKLIDKHVDSDKVFQVLENGYLYDDNDLAFILLRIIASENAKINHGLTFSKAIKLTLEHVLPEKHDQYWGQIDNVEDIKYSIGNMLLIEQVENTKLRNKTLADKCKIYEQLNPLDLVTNPSLHYTNADQESWINLFVKEREKDLIASLKNLI